MSAVGSIRHLLASDSSSSMVNASHILLYLLSRESSGPKTLRVSRNVSKHAITNAHPGRCTRPSAYSTKKKPSSSAERHRCCSATTPLSAHATIIIQYAGKPGTASMIQDNALWGNCFGQRTMQICFKRAAMNCTGADNACEAALQGYSSLALLYYYYI